MSKEKLIEQSGLTEAQYDELDQMQNYFVGEMVFLVERFFIFHQIVTRFPLKLLRRENNRFLDNLLLSMNEDILMKIFKLSLDSDSSSLTIPKFKNKLLRYLQGDRKANLKKQFEAIKNPLINEKKGEFLKLIRMKRLAHHEPHCTIDVEFQEMAFTFEDIIESVKYIVMAFDLLSRCISTHQVLSFNMTYHKLSYDVVFGTKTWIDSKRTTDVEQFIVDYLDRQHPELFLVPIETLRAMKNDRYHEFRDFDDEDFAKVEKLRELKRRTDSEKEHIVLYAQERLNWARKNQNPDPNS